ncbi:hypothetical protein BD410DRAFT_443139 [Rickenella mellea]|uniref:F-box domain-containing protein n=1 Tax=Rickenella mellea TaxID=50990 RepID=A0A4Y7PXD1_9AGAM|nr:hypothetical protein BD410DRAFT_443139 [Rickenella mellea]
MTELGIPILPSLRHLSYVRRPVVSTFSMPRLSHITGYGGLLPVGIGLLSQLTHVTLHLLREDATGIEEFANALHRMTNLKDLSLNLQGCTVSVHLLPMDTTAFPKPHSVHVDRLAISIADEMREYSALLFDALVHLRPSIYELCLKRKGMDPDMFLRPSKNPLLLHSHTIKIHTPARFDPLEIVERLTKVCSTVRMVHFDTPQAEGLIRLFAELLREDAWERIRSIRHLRFEGCDLFSEYTVEVLANNFLRGEAKNGPQCLEVISCKKISEDFLCGLRDEFGDNLKWTL